MKKHTNTRKRKNKNNHKNTKQETNTTTKKSIFKIIGGFLLLTLIPIIDALYSPISDFMNEKWFNKGIQIQLGSSKDKLIDFPIEESKKVYIFYSIPKKAYDSKILLPVSLDVKNTSKNVIKDIVISFKYKKENRPIEFHSFPMMSKGIGMNKDTVYEYNYDKEHFFSNYQIKYLSPKSVINLNDTGLTSNLLDNHKKKIFLTTGKGLEVEVNTYSENDSKKTYYLSYYGTYAQNHEGLNYWVKRFYGTHIALEERANNSFLQYLYNLCFSKEIMVYGIPLEIESLDSSGKVFKSSKNLDSYQGYKIIPYTWELLFKDKSSLPARVLKYFISN